ncbi:MAG: hypothetical protein ACLFR1_08290 [Spirochaetia bacterium]
MNTRLPKICVFLCVMILTSVTGFSVEPDAGFTLSQRFSGAEEVGYEIEVPVPGMYSFAVNSSTGASVSLLDRTAGVIASHGAPGSMDGRLDILLDRGEYLVRIQPDRENTGTFRLSGRLCTEANSREEKNAVLALEDGEYLETTLNDSMQRTYWIYIDDEDEDFALEVMGRNLEACAVWEDSDLVVQEHSVTQYSPVTGRPMGYLELTERLSPGFYRLVCYGGSPRVWTDGGEEHPLYIRSGIPYLGSAVHREFSISPFGRDAYRVSGNTNYFQLYDPDFTSFRISAGTFSMWYSRFQNRRTAEIDPDGDDPWCELRYSSRNSENVIVIQGDPGTSVEGTFFESRDRYYFNPSDGQGVRDYWISSLSSIQARDVLDVTPFLLHDQEFIRGEFQELSPDAPFLRRVNIANENGVFLHITRGGTYQVLESDDSGAAAQYSFVNIRDMATAVQPLVYSPGEGIDLAPGKYIMIITPENQGILHFCVAHEEDVQNISFNASTAPRPQTDFQWSPVNINYNSTEPYILTLNQRQDVTAGLQVRELPLDLTNPLPVFLGPGEEVSAPVLFQGNQRLIVSGNSPELYLENREVSSGTQVRQGRQTLRLRNPGEEPVRFTLSAESIYELRTPVPPNVLSVENSLETITDSTSIYSDYTREETKRFFLRVDQPSFYRLETTGRLAASISVRTPVRTSLFSESQNGEGRNALIYTYLSPGDYIVDVSSLGRSEGRMGVRLQEVTPAHTGAVHNNGILRAVSEPDQPLVYEIYIAQEGNYRINNLGLYSDFNFRLFDQQMWPVGSPVYSGRFQGTLSPGEYSLISLPEPIENRRLVTLYHQDEQQPLEEGNQWSLGINERRVRTWYETEDRAPQVFILSLSAPCTGRLSVSNEMAVTVFSADGQELAVIPGEPRDFPAGDLRIEAVSIEEDNRKEYALGFYTDELIPGTVQSVSELPAEITVNIDEAAQGRLTSFGRRDVRGVLYAPSGEVAAENDDMQGDWNFRITAPLSSGEYLLRIEDSGVRARGNVEVRFEALRTRRAPMTRVPFTQELGGYSSYEVPFSTGNAAELVRFTAENCIISLFLDNRQVAQQRGRLIIPLSENTDYLLAVSAPESMTGEVNAEVLETETLRLSDTAVSNVSAPAARIFPENGVSFRVSGQGSELLYAQTLNTPCTAYSGETVTSSLGGWLVADSGEIGTIRLSQAEVLPSVQAGGNISGPSYRFSASVPENTVSVFRTASAGGRAGIAAVRGTAELDYRMRWQAMSVQPSQSLTAAIGPGELIVPVWDTNPEANIGQFTLFRQDLPISGTLAMERERDLLSSVAPGRAVRVNASQGAYTVLLSPQMAVFTRENGRTANFFWSGEDHTTANISVSTGEIYVASLANRGEEAVFRIYSSPDAAQEAFIISRGNVVTGSASRLPNFQVRIEDLSGSSVYFYGRTEEIVLMGDDGRWYFPETRDNSNIKIFPAVNGTLMAAGAEGQWAIAAGESAFDAFFGEVPPGLSEISGTQTYTLRSGVNRIVYAVPEQGVVRFDINRPGLFGMAQGNNRTILSVPEPGTANRYLAPGNAVIFFLPFTEPEAGQIGFAFSEAQNISEGRENEPVFLADGETAAFVFQVEAEANVGVGAAAVSETVSGALYDSGSQLIDTGPLVFADLEPGEYIFLVHAEAGPVRFTPVLFGTEGTRTEIPADLLEEYTQGRNER